MFSFFQKTLVPKMAMISRLRYITVLRDAFMLAFPITIVGSFAVVLMNLPFVPPSVTGFFGSLFSNVPNATMGIMGVFTTFGIGYYLAESRDHKSEAHFTGITSLSAFLLVAGTVFVTTQGETINGVYEVSKLGASGMFVGIIVAFLAAELYCFVVSKGWKITMPSMVPPTVSKSFSALIPCVFSLTTIAIINYAIVTLTGQTLHALVFTTLQAPLLKIGATLPAFLLATFLVQFFWFFGIHGHNVVNPITGPIYTTLGLQNYEAFIAGQPLPNIITQQFQDIFTVSLGGSGMTLIVVLLMIFVMKSKHLKELGKLAIGPGIFNVNEPVTFGLPVVLNPIAIIPWILGTLIATAVAYYAMYFGLVPYTTGVAVPWTTPIFISGFMATNSIMGALLQLVQALIVGVIWFPFLKIMDKQYSEKNRKEDGEYIDPIEEAERV